MPTAAKYVAYSLEKLGVRHVFGVGGANIEDLFDAVHRTPALLGVLAKHEFSAATMADGYARVGAPLGVVMATSGGGALNLVPALAESYASCVPVLALVGQPPTSMEGHGAFQDGSGRGGSIDARELFRSVSVHCESLASADELPYALHQALSAALGERPGPAVLLLPKDVQRAKVDPHAPAYDLRPSRGRRAPAEDDVKAAAELLAGARSVLVIAGDGVARHHARNELAALVERLDARVALAPDARDVYDNGDRRFIGLAGVMGNRSLTEQLAHTDACVVVGTRLPHLAHAGIEGELARRPLISVHFEPSFEAGAPRIELIGHVKLGLRDLVAQLAARPAQVVEVVPPEESAPTFLSGTRTAGALRFGDALQAIMAAMPDDANVIVDAGNTGASAVHWMRSPSRGRFVLALGMGGMGYSFGAATGAAFANGRRTFVLAGDGAFFMHGLEIHTALQHDLPITFILFDNNAHGMCVTREHLYFGGDYSYNTFRRSKLASGLGAMFPALKVLPGRSAEEIEHSLRVPCAGPSVMCIDVDVREIPPFLPFLQAVRPGGNGGPG
ncbi:MAG: thiamine pyrophosphate-binding protein [Reyranella sp.]|nr:thiamine pyrophosphate-binding protein [Reyranella sp.]